MPPLLILPCSLLHDFSTWDCMYQRCCHQSNLMDVQPGELTGAVYSSINCRDNRCCLLLLCITLLTFVSTHSSLQMPALQPRLDFCKLTVLAWVGLRTPSHSIHIPSLRLIQPRTFVYIQLYGKIFYIKCVFIYLIYMTKICVLIHVYSCIILVFLLYTFVSYCTCLELHRRFAFQK